MTRRPISQTQASEVDISAPLNNLIISVGEEIFTRIKRQTADETHELCVQRSNNSASMNFPRFVEQNRAALSQAELEVSHWQKELQSKTVMRERQTQILIESFVASRSRSQQDEQRITKLTTELEEVKALIGSKDRVLADMRIENGNLREEVRKVQEYSKEVELKHQQFDERFLKNDTIVSSNNQTVVDSLAKIKTELEDVSDIAVKASGDSEASLERINELLVSKRGSTTPDGAVAQLREDVARHETSIQKFLTDIFGESGLLIRVADHDDKFDAIDAKSSNELISPTIIALQGRVEAVEIQQLTFEEKFKEFDRDLQTKDEDLGEEFKRLDESITSLESQMTGLRTTIETVQKSREDVNLAKIEELQSGSNECERRIEVLELSERRLTKEVTGLHMQIEQRPPTPPSIQTPLSNGETHNAKDFAPDIEQLREVIRFLEDRYNNLTTEQVVRCMVDQMKKMYPLDAERDNIRQLWQQIAIFQNENLIYREQVAGQFMALKLQRDSMLGSIKQALNISEMANSCVKEVQKKMDELLETSAETRRVDKSSDVSARIENLEQSDVEEKTTLQSLATSIDEVNSKFCNHDELFRLAEESMNIRRTEINDVSHRTDELEENMNRESSENLIKFSGQDRVNRALKDSSDNTDTKVVELLDEIGHIRHDVSAIQERFGTEEEGLLLAHNTCRERLDQHGERLDQHDKDLDAGKKQLRGFERPRQHSRSSTSTPSAGNTSSTSSSLDKAADLPDAVAKLDKRRRRESRKAAEAAATAGKPASIPTNPVKSERAPLSSELSQPKRTHPPVDLTDD